LSRPEEHDHAQNKDSCSNDASKDALGYALENPLTSERPANHSNHGRQHKWPRRGDLSALRGEIDRHSRPIDD
jgi:hypothetical protein